MVGRALQAAKLLSDDGIQARVINMSTIRPLDTATLFKAANETGAVVVAEEHLVHSGLGALCAQALASQNPVPMEFVGIQNRYGESGKWFEILELLGLTVEGITDATHRVLSRK
jgi:transketolase